MSLTPHVGSMQSFVGFIARVRIPTKVQQTVVLLVSVVMTANMSLKAGSPKRGKHQAMHWLGEVLPIQSQGDYVIAPCIQTLLQNSSLPKLDRTVREFDLPIHAADVA